jgi:ribonuclease HI
VEHIESHNGSQLIYTDGSKTKDQVGYAAVINESTYSYKINNMASIFTAELLAILRATDAIKREQGQSFVICSDSRSALEALHRDRIDHPIVLQLRKNIIYLAQNGKHVSFCWCPAHVGIQGNESADSAARNAYVLDTKHKDLPYSDYLPVIKGKIWENWQISWDGNITDKLRKVKFSVKPWTNACYKNRRVETAIARLRIGHTRITHEHLMSRKQPRQCRRCQVVLSVEHILVVCPNFKKQRNDIFRSIPVPLTLNKILSEGDYFQIDNVIKFFKNIGMFYYI